MFKLGSGWTYVVLRDEMDQLTIKAHGERPMTSTKPACVSYDSVKHWLDVRLGARDYTQDLGCSLLPLHRLTQGARDLGVRRRWWATLLGMLNRCPAPRAELSVRYGIVLLAPGTLHAGASSWAAGPGRMSMERLVSPRREVKAIQQRSSMQPRGASLSIRHEHSPLGPLPDRCQLPHVTSMATVERTSQSDPHGLPREAGGRQKRLLGLRWVFPIGASCF